MLKITHKGGGFDPDAYPEDWVSYEIQDHPAEFSPEDVYRAANRIDGPATDQAQLPTEWQRAIRRAIDEHRAPSMSVGDTIDVHSDSGVLLVRILCDRVGWLRIAPEEVA